MTRQELSAQFYQNHQQFVDYVNTLQDGELMFSCDGKWNAGQQLEHVYLCLTPLVRALASKEWIAQKFGKINRPVLDYDNIIANYKAALANGGKAPEQFLPPAFDVANKAAIAEGIIGHTQAICRLMEDYADEELDTLVLPHPLLGNLTIREMLFLMTYHANHHHKQTGHNLESYNGN